MPMKSQNKPKSKKTKILIIIGSILLLVVIGVVCFFVIQKYKRNQAALVAERLANEQKAIQNDILEQTGALNAGGIAGSVDHGDQEFWNNPVAVASYVADACRRGQDFQNTSSGCQLIPPGAKTINEKEWAKRCSDAVNKNYVISNTNVISTAIDQAVDAFISQIKNADYVEKGSDKGVNSATNIADCKSKLKKELAKPMSWSSMSAKIERDCVVSGGDLNGRLKKYVAGSMQPASDLDWFGTTCWFFAKGDAGKATSEKYGRNVRSALKDNLTAKITKALWTADYAATHSATDEGFLMVYPMDSNCEKMRKEAQDVCVANVEKLISSGVITSIDQINARSQESTTSSNINE